MVRSWLRFILDPSNGQIGKFENDRRGIERLLQGLVDHQRLTASTPVATIANLLTVELYGILVAWGLMTKQALNNAYATTAMSPSVPC